MVKKWGKWSCEHKNGLIIKFGRLGGVRLTKEWRTRIDNKETRFLWLAMATMFEDTMR